MNRSYNGQLLWVAVGHSPVDNYPVAVVLALAACHGSAPASLPPTASKGSTVGDAAPGTLRAEVTGTLADVGLDATSLDRSVDPCVDFYQFACGGWLEHHDIPADRAGWDPRTEVEERNRTRIRELLEADASGANTDAVSQQLGDYYASCMDAAGIEKARLAPIKTLLTTTMGVKDAKSWFAAVVELHKLRFPVVWNLSVVPDATDSTTNVLYLDAAELELPGRDYYVDSAFKDKLDAYRIHVGKMLALVGGPAAKTMRAAADVVAIEVEIAKRSKARVERRDLVAAYNPVDMKGLSSLVKSVDWPAYWSALGIAPGEKVVLVAPKFFAELDALRTKFSPAQWASYFTYHAVSWQAFDLGKVIDDEDFELQKVLWGVTAQRERSARCIEETTGALGDLLGRQYVEKYFPASSKQAVTKLVDAIATAVGDDIADLDWMSPATKKSAASKLAGLVRMVGYPDNWKTYGFVVKRDDFAGNEMRASAFNYRRLLSRIGKPVDRSEWTMNAFTVNAYYDSATNESALPAGFLQPPYFGPERSIPVNLGGLGWYIGHELTHAFDDQGARFDVSGNLKDWWQPEDKAAFEAKAACVADQYSTFEALPGHFVNGRLTVGEDIADLGGVKAAFHAYRTLRKDATSTYVADGFTEDQQFFLAVAQVLCTKMRRATMQQRLAGDTHAPPQFRVYGALRNLPAFAEAFHCARGAPMNPVDRCQVW